MEERKRFLFVWWTGGGNMPPALHLVRQLIARGHTVRVLCDPVSETEFRAAGASFTAFRRAPHRIDLRPENDPIRDWEAQNPRQALAIVRDRILFGPAAGYADDTTDEIASFQPDVVAIMDFTFGAMAAAEKAGLPTAVIAPHILAYPVPGRPPFGPGLLPAERLVDRIHHRLIGILSNRELRKGLALFNMTRARLGLPPVKQVFEQVEHMQRILVLTSLALELPSGVLPPNVRYTGPVLADPDWVGTWQSPWNANDYRPLVLVGFSTTFQKQTECLNTVAEALGRLPVRGLITVGKTIAPQSITAPENVVVCQAAPHSKLLPEVAVMITHAGHGSVVKALGHGVPLLCVPMGRDQNDIAARVVYHGAGLRLSTSASADQLAEATKTLLEDAAYRTAARRLGDAICQSAWNSSTIDELEQLAGLNNRTRNVKITRKELVEAGRSQLFPLDGAGRFVGNVVENSADARDGQKLRGEPVQ